MMHVAHASQKSLNVTIESIWTPRSRCRMLFRCCSRPTKRLSLFLRRSRPPSKSQYEADVFSQTTSVFSLNIPQRKDLFLSVFLISPFWAFHFLLCDLSVLFSLKAVVGLALPSASLHGLSGSLVLCVSSNLDLHFQRSVIYVWHWPSLCINTVNFSALLLATWHLRCRYKKKQQKKQQRELL